MISLGVPLMRIGDVLIASVRTELDDEGAIAFAAEVTRRVSAERIRGLLLDVSGLEIIDSFTARQFVEITTMGRLLGARVVVAGMRPPVAITLVELGLSLPGIETALTVEQAMQMLSGRSGTDARRQPGSGSIDEGR